MNVLIDPGHGGQDPGAVAQGLRECDINLSVAALLAACLKEQGGKTWMTRREDKFVSLRGRTNLEHHLSPDLTISLHCNAAVNVGAHGFEVWTSIGETASDRAAYHVINAIQNAFPMRRLRYDITDGEQVWDKDREKNLWMCRRTFGPAILVEMGFITHAEEAVWLGTKENQALLARAIADGAIKWQRERGGKA
jgi:N-acetylmuramoyl-L-alanine amidase